MHVQLIELAATQGDVFARWQLVDLDWTNDAIAHRTAGMTRLHSGVFLTSRSPVTQRQRWWAATLTAPGSVLSHYSAAACHGFLQARNRSIEAITRPGAGGRREIKGLLVFHSTTLKGNTTTRDGIPVTTPERTLIDLAPHLGAKALRKAFREAIRLRLTTSREVQHAIAAHPQRRGTPALNALATQYARLQIDRTKSDAEALALTVLDAAGIPPPRVNHHLAGCEADLSWPQYHLVIEIDGPQWHRHKDDDARKTTVWRNHGYDVRRITSDDVFDHPERLLALAPIASKT